MRNVQLTLDPQKYLSLFVCLSDNLSGRLQHNRVSCNQGWRNLGHSQVNRIIERRDCEDDTQWDLQ